MTYIAHALGCDAIKFQMHVLENEMLTEVPTSDNFDEPLYKTLQDTELTLDEHKELKSLCENLGIDYLCTPFSVRAADILETMKLDKKVIAGSARLILVKSAGQGLIDSSSEKRQIVAAINACQTTS